MKARARRVLSRMIRGEAAENSDDLTSDPGDIDGGGEVQWMKRDKALYAQHDAGAGTYRAIYSQRQDSLRTS